MNRSQTRTTLRQTHRHFPFFSSYTQFSSSYRHKNGPQQHKTKTKTETHIPSHIYIDELIIDMSTKIPVSTTASGKKPATSTSTSPISTSPQDQNLTDQDRPNDQQQDQQQDGPYWQGMGFIGTQCLFPFPGQSGAPFFDGKNITQFLTMWEDLTLEWPEEIKIKKIPPYCKNTMGKYIRTPPSFDRGNWANFKTEVLEEFKDDDEEQQKYTVAYLRKSVQQIRKSKDADYRAFILDFTEK